MLEADLHTRLPRKLHFPGKIIELLSRTKEQETLPMLEQGISMGRGGVFLILTEEQCGKLKLSATISFARGLYFARTVQ